MKTSSSLIVVCRSLLLVFVSQYAMAVDTSQTIETEYYRVMGNKIDANTFIGYNVYHQTCVRCHGVAGEGTDVAPNLVDGMEYLTPDLFRIKVLHKFAIKFSSDDWINMERSMFEEIQKQEQRDKSEIANMPPWQSNPMVAENVRNIYRYLKARSDGVIDADKPGLLGN